MHYISQGTGGKCVKLKCHDEHVKIFDHKNDFETALYQSKQTKSDDIPSAEVHLLFGQTCDLDQLNENILISMTIFSCSAKIMEQKQYSEIFQVPIV